MYMTQAMTVDEALSHADEWVKGQTFYQGAQGWRVVCAVLAAEVRRLRAGDQSYVDTIEDLHDEIGRLRDEKQQAIAHIEGLRTVLSELEESCEYWSEYDVPLGIVERIKAALKKARGGQ